MPIYKYSPQGCGAKQVTGYMSARVAAEAENETETEKGRDRIKKAIEEGLLY